MTDTTAQEPTMEEILASIRRIISEDDAPAASPVAEAPAPQALAPVEPTHTPSAYELAPAEEEILDLTDRYEAPETGDSIGDLDLGPDPAPQSFPAAFHSESAVSHDPAPSVSSVPFDSLVGDSAAASASSAFAGFAASLKQAEPAPVAGGTGPTIDDLARSLLRPLLKEWLDANLPGIVETAVRKEVERIARSAG